MPLPKMNDILESIKLLSDTYTKNEKKFRTVSNLSDTVTDPMTIFVHAVFSGVKTDDEWFKLEKIRRMDKAFTNQIGLFHEKILSSIDGWRKPKGGFDLECIERKIIVEIKNKHNTMNSSSANDTYEKCHRFYKSNRDWTVYLAQIIPKNGRIDTPWCISGRSQNEQIRLIDGATLYDMVTNETDALKSIYVSIQDVVNDLNLKINETQISMILKAYESCYK